MIHRFYNQSRHVIVVIYDGPITEKFMGAYEKFVHESFASLKKGEKITNITDLSRGKIASSELIERFAQLTEQYITQTEMIYITGMSAFVRILYKTYLRIVGNHEIHMIAKEPLDVICDRFNIETPNIYYDLHNDSSLKH